MVSSIFHDGFHIHSEQGCVSFCDGAKLLNGDRVVGTAYVVGFQVLRREIQNGEVEGALHLLQSIGSPLVSTHRKQIQKIQDPGGVGGGEYGIGLGGFQGDGEGRISSGIFPADLVDGRSEQGIQFPQ